MTDTDDYRSLFLSDAPMIDTRAPAEFARGSFPHARNLPLMTDAERAQVGTCYKQQGQDAAIELGHSLVCGDVKTERVNQWLAFARQHPDGYLFCWRGGLRSQICQQWLADAGCNYPRIRGGYKAMRRFLLDTMEEAINTRSFVVLGGHTGSAKTELLLQLDNSIDLEGLAHHRGSAFGKRVGGQPAQISFENGLAIDLLKHQYRHPGEVVILEDESRLIGRCALPENLQAAMKQAPLVMVETELEERVEHSFTNYILRNLQDCQALLGETAGFDQFADDLQKALGNIRRRLGGARHSELNTIMVRALEQHRQGDSRGHRQWIETLLRDYYDPMYNYQLQQKQERVVFRGRPQAVVAYLQENRALTGA